MRDVDTSVAFSISYCAPAESDGRARINGADTGNTLGTTHIARHITRIDVDDGITVGRHAEALSRSLGNSVDINLGDDVVRRDGSSEEESGKDILDEHFE